MQLFDNCDLAKAKFDKTVLKKADFRTSYNYSIDPERNRITKAKFSMTGIVGLLDKYDIEVRLRKGNDLFLDRLRRTKENT